MKLIPISAGKFHCDGGALFGVIPKVLWSKVYPVDENNFTQLSLRCLLVDTGDRKVLIETGIGNHYSEKHLQNNGVLAGNHLEESLQENGYAFSDITDVFLTHLHWDHCTGAVYNQGDHLQLTFSNAKLWCSAKQWEHAKTSNIREKAAYHREVLDFMMESGQLQLVHAEGEWIPGVEVRFFDGHTPGLMIPFIRYRERTFVYMSDLIPTAANIPLLWIASYDLYPVTVMEEKKRFLEEAVEKDYVLFFEHDHYAECATLKETEKGVVLRDKFSLKELG